MRNNDAALHKVFMVGEQNFFPEDMKIKRALHTMTYFYPDFDLRRAHGLAKQFGLSLKKKIPALSTGYSSIFRLILGLSVNTPYVIFDEPVLGLGCPASGALLPSSGGKIHGTVLYHSSVHPPNF